MAKVIVYVNVKVITETGASYYLNDVSPAEATHAIGVYMKYMPVREITETHRIVTIGLVSR